MKVTNSFMKAFRRMPEPEEQQLVGVIVAMDAELEMLKKSDAFRFLGDYGENTFGVQMSGYEYTTATGQTVNIVVAKSGIGKVNAAIATAELIRQCCPDYIISTGVCGTMSRQIVVQNDVYIPPFVTYYDVYCGSPNVIGQVQDYPDKYQTFVDELLTGLVRKDVPNVNILHSTTYPIISGDMFVEDKDLARHIDSLGYPLNDYTECGIDMESTAIAQTCYRARVPFATVRIVSDAPLREEWLEQYKYEDFWQKAPDTLHRILKSVIDHCVNIRSTHWFKPDNDGE